MQSCTADSLHFRLSGGMNRPVSGASPVTPCMDAPLSASNFFGHAGQSDQVLSCIRPLDAASQRAAGQYGDTRTRSKSLRRARSSRQSTGFPGPVSMIVCPYLSSVLLTFTTPSRQAAATQAAAVTGSRQLSFFVISAQAMRAIRLAMAMATSLLGLPASMRASHEPSGTPRRTAQRISAMAPTNSNRLRSR